MARLLSLFVSAALAVALLVWPTTARLRFAPRADPPRKSTGLSDVVQWDNYTLFIDGQRVFLHSGEFHTFRLPVPDLWLDIFQKMVAAGLNGVSIYIHMALTNPAPGVLDFDDWRALEPIWTAAEQAGIFIVLRPGPYINAETTAGGLALWSTSLTSSELRTNATDIEESWTPYVKEIIKLTEAAQVSNNGPVIAVQIDNEYSQSPVTRAEYFAQLEETYTSNGIVVPLTYNDPGQGRNFINGTGAVDIYGLDSYPQGFDCSNPTRWSPVVTNYHQYHEEVDPSTVWYMPEFQGGSFDPWGGPGYDQCEVLTGPDFQDVFYKENWASNVKMISYYMLYGGTNWGGIAFPGVYTSYDYGSSIREDRALSPKFDELKRQGLFLRSSPEFKKTDWIGDSTTATSGVTSSSTAAFFTLLKNPDTGAGFVIVRQTDSTSTSPIAFNITVPTSAGALTIPKTISTGVQLNGRQSKVILTDYTFGNAGKLLYSTANVLFAGAIGGVDTVFLYGDADQGHEFALLSGGKTSTFAFTPATFPGGLKVVSAPKASGQPLVLFADTNTASTFFAPHVPSAAADVKFRNFFQFGTNETVLVGGPQLVRNATVAGHTLALRGDLNASVPLTLLVPSAVSTVSWNGKAVAVRPLAGAPSFPGAKLLSGSLTFGLGAGSIAVPALTGWKFADSLPEAAAGFDDGAWTTADHTTTNITAPLFGDGRVLYGCDYGFCENVVLWRGHFTGAGAETGANLTINGGSAFAASVFLNDVFLGSTQGSSSEQTNALYAFPEGAVKVGADNVLTVVQDHMGNDEDDTERSPRGIPGFELVGGNFTTWKVQGKVGGYTNYPDKVRGLLNEGGLFGERAGWHLPGFDTSAWTPRALSAGLPGGGAGVGFFVTTFALGVPAGVDAMFSFVFDNGTATPAGADYRALLFVNGWQYGKRVANIGPQARFPVPTGILDPAGDNTVAVALWALQDAPVSPTLALVLDGAVEGGVGPIAINNPPWAPRS
ncbi:glycoside hydrolase family 35 protein [Phlebiopsis gigantea 11061_1 CR5-6]|uniref:beta-galactosidase n=1 Tax=Phlebiopsis gigantea (strain 11061_1 CR5-6) TaxID=745531 RepID=A0A0C3NDX1_PHLG1|nr:glycoside hydrolase family 35 protein [Phlebiopsis gigantea 11061_1 CR5-6]